MIISRLEEHTGAKKKDEKSAVISFLVSQVRMADPKGSFIKCDKRTNRWFDMGDFAAREKISQIFQDILHEKYKSSSKRRRKSYHGRKSNIRLSQFQANSMQNNSTEENLEYALCCDGDQAPKLSMIKEKESAEVH